MIVFIVIGVIFAVIGVIIMLTTHGKKVRCTSVTNAKVVDIIRNVTKDYSSYRNIDFSSLLNANIIFTKTNDRILLYNTHTSESYINSEGYQFEYSGTMRSTDANYNMLDL